MACSLDMGRAGQILIKSLYCFAFLRLGFNERSSGVNDTEAEVDDYLGKAIDARSIDRLRSEHCKGFLLTFRDSSVEAKFSKERDKVLEAYFICSFIIFLALFELQRNILPRYARIQ